MIVDLTADLIRNDQSLSHREARSLVDCAEKSILEMFPSYRRRYDAFIRPHFERLLSERWPLEECGVVQARELVN